MEKQKVLSRIKSNHFDTKGGGACKDAAKSPNTNIELSLFIPIFFYFILGIITVTLHNI